LRGEVNTQVRVEREARVAHLKRNQRVAFLAAVELICNLEVALQWRIELRSKLN
jgi:hypothetical protein